MFVWLGIALIIDGIDGTFARRLRVAELVAALVRRCASIWWLISSLMCSCQPTRWSTADYCRHRFATALGAVIVVTGLLYFADREMKSSDYYFRGFPAVWNVAAFYLFRPEAVAVA